MTIAAVMQLVSGASVEKNLEKLPLLFESAVNQGASLILLPENYAFMGNNERDKFRVAESFGTGVIQEKTQALAKSFGLWVIAGTLPIQAQNERVKSACIVYDDKGKVAARYDKIHLFDVRVSDTEAHEESLTVSPGNDIVVVDTPIGRVGLTVCYDLRFPELYRQLALKGAMIYSIPSAFTKTTGESHWDVLLRARAIENLAYVLAANQGGVHENGRETYGHSTIIEPWGHHMASLTTGEGIISASISLERLHQLRTQFPCGEHHILENRD